MDKLHLDFKNKVIGFDNSGQTGEEIYFDLDKEMLTSCIDSYILKHNCITLDFETEEIIINRDIDYHPEKGQIIVLESFIPIKTYSATGLADKKKDIWDALGITVVNMCFEIDLINLLMNI